MDFERWFQRQGRPAAPPPPPAPSLVDQLEAIGLELHKDGSVFGDCCICGKPICLTEFITAEECLRDVDPENLHCGGSPRCCP